jgi:hypothetical protein
MPVAPLRLVRRCFELAPKTDISLVPSGTRGMYVLYRRHRTRSRTAESKVQFDVVYIGLASGERVGIRGRLNRHRRSKGEHWTHFSIFEVWDNIRNDEVRELEGLFRHIYRFDTHANKLNVAKSYNALTTVRRAAAREDWMSEATTAVPKRPRRPRASKSARGGS